MGAFSGGAGFSLGNGRHRFRPKLSPTARAVRLALALGSATLALSGSGGVLAAVGTCTPPAGTINCDGVFNDANTNVPINYVVEDLTLILGGVDATTTVTDNFTYALSLTGTTGYETLLNYGVVTNDGVYSVRVGTTSGDITIENYNSVVVNGGTFGSSTYAIHADSTDGVVVVDNYLGASVDATNTFGSGTGIHAYSQNGSVTASNDGSVYADANGNAYGIYAQSHNGVVNVDNTGDITADSGSSAYGINAQGYANVFVDNSGSIAATSTGNYAYGVFLYTCDCAALDASLDNSGTVSASATAGGDAQGVHVYAYGAGNVNITNDGYTDVSATGGFGADAAGIYVNLDDGTTTIDGAGTISVYAYNDADGIYVVVDNDGATSIKLEAGGVIDVTGYAGYGRGIYVAGDGDGDIYVGNAGSIDVYGYNYAVGVHAYSNYLGDVTIDNSGTITVDAPSGAATGIMTSSHDSDTLVDNSGSIGVTTSSAGGSILGINAYGYDQGTVHNSGTITVDAQGAGSYATGIMVITFYGDIYVDSTGSITATASDDAYGIDISGNDGNVKVVTDGTIDTDSSGSYAYGIHIGVYGYGDVYVDNSADITAKTVDNWSTGVSVYAYYGYITIHNDGDITATSTGTGETHGIFAEHGDYGDIIVTSAGAITLAGGGVSYGIYAYTQGDIDVTNSGTIDATSTANEAYGVMAHADGAGAVTVDSAAGSVIDVHGYLNAYGIDAYANGTGAVDVTSSGTITVVSDDGYAAGVRAAAYGANASVDNGGTIEVTTQGAFSPAIGVDAYGYIDAYVANNGSITVDAYGAGSNATGIDATSQTGNTSVQGAGSVDVYGVADAYGIHATTYGAGYVYVASGAITVDSYGGVGYGVMAFTDGAGKVSVDLSGDVAVTAYGQATGLYASGYDGNVSVYTSGDTSATATASGSYSFGIFAESYDGDVDVTSHGVVTASSDGLAYGIYAQSYGNVDVTSTGAINATSQRDYNGAYGIFTDGYGVTVDSGGAIVANAYGYGSGAIGIHANAADGGVVIDSTGAITVHGSASTYGMQAAASGLGSVAITSDGDIDVTSSDGSAYGVLASTSGAGYVRVDATGDVLADGDLGAYGIKAYASGIGSVSVSSSGTISATATDGSAAGIHASSAANNAGIDVTGGSVHASSATGNAEGLHAYGYGDAYVYSDAAVSAHALAGQASGIFAEAYTGNVVVDATGAIDVTADDQAYGINAQTQQDGYVAVTSGGDIDVGGPSSLAAGINALSGGAGNVYVHNYGDITVTGPYLSMGIQAGSYQDGDVYVTSTGDFDVRSDYSNAFGIRAQSSLGGVSVDASGSIYANGGTFTWGILAGGYTDVGVDSSAYIHAAGGTSAAGIVAQSNVGVASVLSSGDIVAVSGSNYAAGILAAGGTDVYVNSSGDISATSATKYAAGIDAGAYLGDVDVLASGAIDVSAHGLAFGIYASTALGGDIHVTSSGPMVVDSATDIAHGILARASGAGIAVVDNSGAITVSAYADAGGIEAFTDDGDASVTNSGAIDVSSQHGLGTGISAVADGGGAVSVASAGDIAASGYSYATGIYAYSAGDLGLVVDGAIAANATGDDFADAKGVYGFGYDINFTMADSIAANGSADPDTGSAYADGVHLDGDDVSINMGAASAISASADGYYANAVGLEVNGSYGLYLGLAGDIQASAAGDFAWATGVQATSYVDVLAYNNADITATANGSGYAAAYGVRIGTFGDIFFYNGGNISATAADYAVAVQLDAVGNTVFINNGTIAAYADDDGGIAFLSGDADDSIYDNGTITGAIVTGDGDDELEVAYGATWNAFGVSDFGAGDDSITNYGTIHMSDAVIDLGLPGSLGNSFCNYGLITVSGAYNIIDMEGGSATSAKMDAALAAGPGPLASSNAYAFYNYGTIDFQDGAPDDQLVVIGDFGGPDGIINLDVSGLNGTGDLLYIEGDVLSDVVQTINVDMVDMPADGVVEVPVVEVSGNSVAGNFVLGSVDFTPIPFVTTSFSLVSHLSNSSPDQFSLRVGLGVDRDGAIAADLPAGVQLLINDVVGSWHKRQGGFDEQGGKKYSLWARLYHNKGKVDPDFDSDSMDDADFDFEQKNYGGEAGFDFAPNGKWSFGIMLGKANADQDLRVGLGSDRIQGNVAGGYGTFHLPRGFYFDLSHRRMNFDAVVHTANGNLLASGRAEATNAESGYSFSFHGFEFEGQLQVTHTKLVSLDNLVGDSSYSPPEALAKGAASLAAPAPAQPVGFDNDADISTTTRAGWDMRKKFKSGAGTLWELHATMNRIRMVGGQNAFEVTDGMGGQTDIGGNSSLLDVGFTARRGLLLMYGAVTWQDGGALQNFMGVQLGAKYTW